MSDRRVASAGRPAASAVVLLAVVLLLASGLVGGGAVSRATAASTTTDPALQSAPLDRLDRLADELRRSPLAVDPELDWLVDARTRRAMERTLRRAEVPMLVAVVPQENADESGGDAERILLGLQRRLRRDAFYVVVDPDGVIDGSPKGIDRPLDVAPELRDPPSTPPRREGAAPVRLFDSVPGRLTRLVDRVDGAPRTGTPAPGVTTVLPLLPATSGLGDLDTDEDGDSTLGTVAVSLLIGAGVGAVIARRRIRRDRARWDGTAHGGGPPGGGRRGAGWLGRGRRTPEQRVADRQARAERRRLRRKSDERRKGTSRWGRDDR